MRVALLSFALVLSGCSVIAPPTRMIPDWSRDWHRVATESDRKRLRDWRQTFVAAIDAARKSGHSAEIAREGVLLDPDAALGGGPIPNGAYRCRVIKVGAKSQGMLDYVAYPAFTCSIAAQRDLQQLAKLNGSQRQFGLIFPGDLLRQVFLGTLVLGDETRALQYGQDDSRDVVGYVERIGPNRWRLVMPSPHFESQLDVMELVPAG
ncbi:MAG TPA: DUF4893 domain-containing protein [Sphingomicrobium sp.]|jgi:hypothetical protein|nr:DUF4893 domain-containing protein [Sphingomicrobium sp.]